MYIRALGNLKLTVILAIPDRVLSAMHLYELKIFKNLENPSQLSQIIPLRWRLWGQGHQAGEHHDIVLFLYLNSTFLTVVNYFRSLKSLLNHPWQSCQLIYAGTLLCSVGGIFSPDWHHSINSKLQDNCKLLPSQPICSNWSRVLVKAFSYLAAEKSQ